MELQVIKSDFTICKVEDMSQINFDRTYVFVSKTDDEISLVCESAYVPQNSYCYEANWKALKISGILDFSLVGIIAEISNILAKNNISIFVISTYNTDYILLKLDNLKETIALLMKKGYTITNN